MNNSIWLMLFITILHVGPMLNVLGMLPGGRVYVLTAAAHFMALLFTLNYLGRASRSQGRALTMLDMLVTAYLGWSCVSILLYLQDNAPTSLEGYFHGIHDFTLPICSYFIAKHLDRKQLMKGLHFIVYANLIAMVIGLLMFYLRPDFYTNFLRETSLGKNGELEVWQIYARLQSYFGSTAVGILSAVSIVLIRLTNPPVIVAFTGVGIFCTSALLSQQRAGMAAAALALAYFTIFNKGRRITGMVVIAIGVLLSTLVLTALDDQHGGIIESILNRSTETEGMLESRSGYVTVYDYIIEFPFGSGIGASGGSSDGLQDRGKVVDANFMRILADLGIQGLALFLAVVVGAGLTALKRTDRIGWLTIITIYMLVMVGTNTLDSHYVSHLFWILLAAMDTPEERKAAVKTVLVVEEEPHDASAALGSV